jgi:hypothetical protein
MRLSSEATRRLRQIIAENVLPSEELARRERAALRIRERFISSPFYSEKDRKFGMEYWRILQASAVNLYPDA